MKGGEGPNPAHSHHQELPLKSAGIPGAECLWDWIKTVQQCLGMLFKKKIAKVGGLKMTENKII